MTEESPSNSPTPIVTINGMEFVPIPGISYKYNYNKLYFELQKNLDHKQELAAYRHCILNDLWFIVYFVLKWPRANHKFIVDACSEIESGPQTQTIDLWFREAGKSTVITIARSIQEVLRNPSERVCIFSYARSPALSFLRNIKNILETSEILKACFPDVLYQDPEKEASKWSELEGLIVKRTGFHKESSFEAHGLLEGMPTGKHFSLLVFDDIVTADLVQTPDIMEKVKERVDMAINVGTADGRHRVVGTFYHHEDPLKYLEGKKDLNGIPLYLTRKKPATVDGSFSGKSIFLPEARLALLRSNRQQFNCQQLLDPTPISDQKLDFNKIIHIPYSLIPDRLYKFMVVDSAGSEGKRRDHRETDAWACWVIGVAPEIDDKGASDIYLLDGFIESLSLDEAMNKIVACYMRNGRVISIGVEKVGAMTFEVHVANALRAKSRHISVESGSLSILTPAGRNKQSRIEQNLLWPLNNGKIHVTPKISNPCLERLKMEMDKYPYWKDDGIDALSYIYDMIKNYRFGRIPTQEELDMEITSRKQWKNLEPLANWMTI
jgi:hypothetical protein